MKYDITEIAKIVRADFTLRKACTVSALLTDSRSLTFPEETLFFALVTDRNDGHRYIGDLYRKGVRNFVISHRPDDEEAMPEANFLLVSDTLQALQTLAAAHRRRFRKGAYKADQYASVYFLSSVYLPLQCGKEQRRQFSERDASSFETIQCGRGGRYSMDL